MLDGLDSVPWSELTHAYGPAEDVPDLIRALASPEKKYRRRAIHALYGNIWHQGTVYLATSHAVPFLVELLREPTVLGKAEILRFLHVISQGSSYLDVHQHLEWYRHERATDKFQETLADELYWVRRAHEAVSDGASVYLDLLRGSISEAIQAAHVLANCTQRFEVVEPGLREQVDRPAPSLVKASALWAWLSLRRQARPPEARPREGRAAERRLLKSLKRSRSEHRFVRTLAALALLHDRPDREEADKSVRVLARSLARTHRHLERFPWSTGAPLVLVADTLHRRPSLLLDLVAVIAADPGHPLRKSAGYHLERIAQDRPDSRGRIVVLLADLLNDETAEIRRTAALQLVGMGRSIRLVRDSLVKSLEVGDEEVAKFAAIALSKLGDERAVPALVSRLARSETDHWTLEAVKRLGAKASEAIPYLRRLVRETTGNSRVVAAHALGLMGAASVAAIHEVAAFLPEGHEGAGAAWALMHWGELARPVLPGVLEFLARPGGEGQTRTNAVKAVRAMGLTEASRPALLRLLDDPGSGVRAAACAALGNTSPVEPRVLEVLEELLDPAEKGHQRSYDAVNALEALEAIGRAGQSLAAKVKPYLDDHYQWARVGAARALWRMGEPVGEFLPPLIDELRCRPVGILAAECLAEMGPLARPALPRLRELLNSTRSVSEGGSIGEMIEDEERFLEAVGRAAGAIEP